MFEIKGAPNLFFAEWEQIFCKSNAECENNTKSKNKRAHEDKTLIICVTFGCVFTAEKQQDDQNKRWTLNRGKPNGFIPKMELTRVVLEGAVAFPAIYLDLSYIAVTDGCIVMDKMIFIKKYVVFVI